MLSVFSIYRENARTHVSRLFAEVDSNRPTLGIRAHEPRPLDSAAHAPPTSYRPAPLSKFCSVNVDGVAVSVSAIRQVVVEMLRERDVAQRERRVQAALTAPLSSSQPAQKDSLVDASNSSDSSPGAAEDDYTDDFEEFEEENGDDLTSSPDKIAGPSSHESGPSITDASDEADTKPTEIDSNVQTDQISSPAEDAAIAETSAADDLAHLPAKVLENEEESSLTERATMAGSAIAEPDQGPHILIVSEHSQDLVSTPTQSPTASSLEPLDSLASDADVSADQLVLLRSVIAKKRRQQRESRRKKKQQVAGGHTDSMAKPDGVAGLMEETSSGKQTVSRCMNRKNGCLSACAIEPLFVNCLWA